MKERRNETNHHEYGGCAGCIFRRLNPYFQEHCALGVMKKPSGWNIEDEDEGEGKENDQ